jgi:hypothetical protein
MRPYSSAKKRHYPANMPTAIADTVGKSRQPIQPNVVAFMCYGCGATAYSDKVHCPKCGGMKFDKIYARLVLNENL